MGCPGLTSQERNAVRWFSACTVGNVDILPEGEALPKEPRDILARALDGLETPQAPSPDDVIDLIAPDLVATLGWTFDQAREAVATAGVVYEQDPVPRSPSGQMVRPSTRPVLSVPMISARSPFIGTV